MVEISPASPDVFLLGAGFSRAVSRHMPLLPDLARGVLDRYPTQQYVAPDVVTLMEENFAHALSYLEHPKPWLSEAENLRHRGLFLECSAVIAQLLDEAVHETLQASRGRAPAWLGALIQHWHHQRCIVVTLNHDTLIETVASEVVRQGEPLWAHFIYPPLLTDARLRAGDWEPFPPRDTFVLLKLHGSTNWYYSGRTSAFGEPIYFVNPKAATRPDPGYERRMRAVADKYPFLVPPIYDQSALLTHETIRALWQQAGHRLRRARRIVCMGYSLPPSDIIMHHFLRTTLPEGVVVEVVDENPAVVENYERALQRTAAQVAGNYTGPDAIARFVASLAPVAG